MNWWISIAARRKIFLLTPNKIRCFPFFPQRRHLVIKQNHIIVYICEKINIFIYPIALSTTVCLSGVAGREKRVAVKNGIQFLLQILYIFVLILLKHWNITATIFYLSNQSKNRPFEMATRIRYCCGLLHESCNSIPYCKIVRSKQGVLSKGCRLS